MSSKKKVPVGKLFFNGKHRLVIESLLEFGESGYPSDVVFIEMHENLHQDNIIRMQVTCQDLYEIIEGAKELFTVAKGLTPKEGGAPKEASLKSFGGYSKFTKSAHFSSKLTYGVKLSQKMKNGVPVVPVVPVVYEAQYFLNVTRKNNGASDTQTLVIGFNPFSIRAFIERVGFLCQRIDTALYDAQAEVAEAKKNMTSPSGGINGQRENKSKTR